MCRRCSSQNYAFSPCNIYKMQKRKHCYGFNKHLCPILFLCNLRGKEDIFPIKFCNLATDSTSKSCKCAAYSACLFGNMNMVPRNLWPLHLKKPLTPPLWKVSINLCKRRSRYIKHHPIGHVLACSKTRLLQSARGARVKLVE